MRSLYFYLNLFLCMTDDTELPMILLTDRNYFILFAFLFFSFRVLGDKIHNQYNDSEFSSSI